MLLSGDRRECEKMNSTTQGIDARGYLIGWLKGVTAMTTADIQAVPEEKWTATFGGCTRPANELTADAISLLLWAARALKGDASAEGYGDSMNNLAAEITTKDAAIAKLNSTVDELAAALSTASEETLAKTVTAPWGMDTPLYMAMQIAVSHIWYHDGQLNYIHCLLGDKNIYWKG